MKWQSWEIKFSEIKKYRIKHVNSTSKPQSPANSLSDFHVMSLRWPSDKWHLSQPLKRKRDIFYCTSCVLKNLSKMCTFSVDQCLFYSVFIMYWKELIKAVARHCIWDSFKRSGVTQPWFLWGDTRPDYVKNVESQTLRWKYFVPALEGYKCLYHRKMALQYIKKNIVQTSAFHNLLCFNRALFLLGPSCTFQLSHLPPAPWFIGKPALICCCWDSFQ